MPGHVDVAAKMFLMIIQGSDACAFFRRQQILDDRVSMVVQIRCKGVPVISGETRPGCLASCNTQRILLVHLSLPVCRSGGRMHPVPCFQTRSEEHTSELQSLMRISYAVFCLNKKYNNLQIAYT